MTEKEEKKPTLRLFRGLGVEDLLSGLGDFLSKVEKLAEKGEALEGGKTFEGKGYKGEYKYRVTTIRKEAPRGVGIGIRPGTRYERTRYRPPRIEKPRVVEPEAEVREPLVDCFDKGDHILVVASLPNTKEEDLKYEIVDDTLKITAETPEGKIEKGISIPKDSKVDKIKDVSFKHGILEIKLNKKKERKHGKRK
jgi:HSP20 family molecular chaperone IbpA